jgi:hypothetical protein
VKERRDPQSGALLFAPTEKELEIIALRRAVKSLEKRVAALEKSLKEKSDDDSAR